MELDFDYTCPYIDDNIGYLKDLAKNVLEDFLHDIPDCDSEEDKKNLIKDSACYFVEEFVSMFEKVRQLNSDMRSQAEKQLDSLDNELHDVTEQLKEE